MSAMSRAEALKYLTEQADLPQKVGFAPGMTREQLLGAVTRKLTDALHRANTRLLTCGQPVESAGLTDVEYAALAAPPPDPPGLVALEAAIERTREYIRQAMRSGGVKQAIYATAWDRAHRSGLQHALNALNAEVEKAYPLAALPATDPQAKETR